VSVCQVSDALRDALWHVGNDVVRMGPHQHVTREGGHRDDWPFVVEIGGRCPEQHGERG